MKRNYWPVFFVTIFSFVFCMIVWTVHSAVTNPVNEDETFLKSYHELDGEFNEIVEANQKFLSKYNFKIKINKKESPLVINDMFLAQRAIEEKSNHKNIFHHGENSIVITLMDKKTNEAIKDIKISFRISRPTNNYHNFNFSNKDFKVIDGKYNLDVKLPLKGNWNITATFKIGSDTGYFYLKSNAV
jgi:hypothetical protein